MSIQAENYWFFVIFITLVIIAFLIFYYLKEDKFKYLRFSFLCVVLLIGHIALPFYDVGIFPNLVYDPLFYLLLFLIGMTFTFLYINKIEQKSFQEIGWKSSNLLKEIVIGLVFGVILLLFAAIIMLPFQTTNLENISFFPEKIFTVIFFALGAIYEECLFRGFLQEELEKEFEITKVIIIQALAFLAINLFYFPFNSLGLINYLVMFIMALLLGFLAYKYSLFCSATVHVFFVLFAGLLT